MKTVALALALALPALAVAADPPNPDAPKKTEMQPAADPSNRPPDEEDAKMAPPKSEPLENQTKASASSRDVETLAKLHHDNEMEMKMGELAKKNGASKEVKKFGELLVKDHGMADKQIVSLAKKQNIDLKLPPPKDAAAAADRQAMADTMARLETLRGDEFDRLFARTMVEGHQKAVEMVEATVKQTQDAKVQALLDKLLPVLKEHLRIAQQISKHTESV